MSSERPEHDAENGGVNHGNKAIYCDSEESYILGRTDDGRCPYCGEDLTGARYDALKTRVEENGGRIND